MEKDTIKISRMTVEGMEKALGQDFNKIETPERMAWIVWLLEKVEDTDEAFPMGKWATIQNIKQQLEAISFNYSP